MQGKLHQYRLTTELAKKYSHSTYLASPTDEPEQQVVLILFAPSLFAFPHERETLLQQAQRLKELHHPHLQPILDLGIDHEQPFIVRDYLPNGSLRSILKTAPSQQLALHDALHIVLQVGEALAHAHQRNILHGNIKPENVFLNTNDQIVLTDFTLLHKPNAMIRDQTTEEYAFCYMAPEQFAGTLDACSDQYALGCLAYELITGQVPFAVQTLASMMGHHNTMQPIPLSEKMPQVPPSLDAAVLKTLAHHPSERFFDFSLFLDIIRTVLSPPPAFPLSLSITSRKHRTSSRPAHPLKIEDDLFASLLSQDTSSTDSDDNSLNHQLHISRNNSACTFVYGAITQSEVQTPDTLQHTENESDTTWLSDPFAEQESYELAAIVSTNPVRQRHEIKIYEMALSLPKSTALFLTRPIQHGRRRFLALALICLVILFSAITALGTYSVLFPFRTNISDIPSHATQVVVQAIVPTITSLAGTQLAATTSPSPTAQPTPQITPTPQVVPTPTPTPTPAPLQTTTIDDSVQGTGPSQFNYVGNNWGHCTNGCQGDPPDAYNGSNSWDNTAGNYVTITFTGVQIKFYSVVSSNNHGFGAVSVDGGSETTISSYAAKERGNYLLWTSPMLSAGTHTFKLRVPSNENPSTSNDCVIVDRVTILG